MKFDHVVHFTDSTPEDTVSFWKQQTLHAVVGGRHEKWGTRNALFYGRDSYIEWLAIENREIAERADHPLTKLLLHNGSGFGTLCFRTTSIEELNRRLIGSGFQTSGILDGSRLTAEGKLLEWKMLFINEEPSARLPNPFFIQWNETDTERYEGLKATGAITETQQEIAVSRCVFGVEDVEEMSDRWKVLLGGSLQLPNCLIEFRKLEGHKERLEEVHFENGTKRLAFEKGVYFLP
ncbi:VOC family protein [Metaplanococcus flavidus]|uniref:VOC family protein n=1 Tax=Metaplanococcus flavidus TaxID=569883 RepID=A0ABW3LFT9_9BACL